MTSIGEMSPAKMQMLQGNHGCQEQHREGTHGQHAFDETDSPQASVRWAGSMVTRLHQNATRVLVACSDVDGALAAPTAQPRDARSRDVRYSLGS
jgi:hypothetical protein